MNNCLFDPVEQREGEGQVGESTFEFLRRGGRPEAIEIRKNVESWFQAVPCKKRRGFEKRLQDKDFSNFMGAYFELQLHQVLLRLGCDVRIEPDFVDCPKTVDFLAIHDDQEFCVEATVCGLDEERLNFSGNEHFAVKKIRDELTRRRLLHSDLHLQAEGELRKTLGRRAIEPFVKLLNEHSSDEVRRLVDQYGLGYVTYPWEFENPPIAKLECGDWKLIGCLAPPMASDGLGRVIGPGRSGTFDWSEKIRTSLHRKAKQWRKIEEAADREKFGSIHLIAINVCGPGLCCEPEVSNAIFGTPTPPSQGFGEVQRDLRSTNGVIVVTNDALGRERTAQIRLYQNAGADISKCLESLRGTQRLGDLLGIDP